jgi:hypothetical protein
MLAALQDVVAIVQGGDSPAARAALAACLAAAGARVAARLGKEVTHVVFAGAGAAELAALLRRCEALDFPPAIVDPAWVEESAAAGRRLLEARYAPARPRAPPLAAPGTCGSTGRHRAGGAAAPGRSRRAAAAPPPPLAPGADEDAEDWPDDAEPAAAAAAPAAAGAETQAVADILALNLPAEAAEEEEEEEEEEDGISDEEEEDLDTPLAGRFAPRRSTGGGAKRCAASPAAAARLVSRSRLAAASGPALPAPAPAPAAAPAARRRPAPPARFSVRQLVTHPERPVPLHKGTPLPGAMPPTTARRPGHPRTAAAPIPVPFIERVASPWHAAAELPPSQGEGPATAARGGRAAPGSHVRGAPLGPRGQLPEPWTAARPWDGVGKAGKARGAAAPRPSRFASQALAQEEQAQEEEPAAADEAAKEENKVPETQPEEAPAAAGALEAAEAAPAEEEAEAPPAAPRRGGRRAAAAKAAKAAKAAPPPPKAKATKKAPAAKPKAAKAAAPAASAAKPKAAAKAAAPAPAAAAAAPAAPAARGFLATTAVGSSVAELTRAATRRLRGLRQCAEGAEDGAVTHLVVGAERRTLKVLLAVANGAALVAPEWVTASLDAGRWLPPAGFPGGGRFAAGAARARAALEDPDAAPLLAGLRVHVVGAGAGARRSGSVGGAGAGAGAPALRRLAAALGAPPGASARACDVCVVPAGGRRPAELPKAARAVREEWLLAAAEAYQLPPPEAHLL